MAPFFEKHDLCMLSVHTLCLIIEVSKNIGRNECLIHRVALAELGTLFPISGHLDLYVLQLEGFEPERAVVDTL